MAEEFARRGHRVAGCARSPQALEELQNRLGAPHRFTPVDVSRESEVKAWAKALSDGLGPPDLLLNNAAVMNPNARLWEVPPQAFSNLVDVNIKGVFYCLRHFLPAMVERGSGVVVNFSSGWGRSTAPEVAPYCAGKWAIEGLTRALAKELPPGMAAVPLNPGVIYTDMLAQTFGSSASSYPQPDQWATRAVPFLLGIGAKDNGRPLSVPD